MEEGNSGRIVAIDIETGEFEVGDDTLTASNQLLARCPDAQPWLVRVGHQTVHRLWALSGWYLSTGPTTDERSSRVPRFQIPRECTQ